MQPFVNQLEYWYDVKFKNLSPEDAQNLTRHWDLYAANHGLCDVVQGRP